MSLRDWLLTTLIGLLARPENHATLPAPDAPERRRGIRHEAVANTAMRPAAPPPLYTTRPRAANERTPFEPAKPAPGVLPNGVKPIAMDDASGLAEAYQATAGGYTEGIYWLGYPYLAELTQRAEYRRIVETLAREMTRKWLRLQAKGRESKADKVRLIERELDKHQVQDKFRRVAELDGFFGRGHIYVDAGVSMDDAELLKAPIVIDRRTFPQGALKNLRVVEPNWTYPGAYNSNNPLARDFYRPTTWYVMGREVHHTRLLTFVAREMPDMLKPAYAFGGLSMSQMAKPYVDNWLRSRQSVSDIIHSFSVFLLATDMQSLLQEGGGEQELLRAQIFNNFRDNRGLFMIDKQTEDFKNVSAPLGTLDHLQAQAQEHMASVSGEPLVVLTGITPSGLNASSEGELQVWAQFVKAMQEHLFGQHFRTILQLIQLDVFGEIDEDITFDWNPLNEESALDEANRRKVEADTDVAYVTAGVMDPAEVREKLAGDQDSPYAGVDLSGPPPEPPDLGGDPLETDRDPDAPQAAAARVVESLLDG